MLAELAQQIAEMTGYPIWLISVVFKVLIISLVFFPLISVIAVIAIWGERKVAGHIQGRLGPKHVGPFGLLQSPADGIKLLFKEDTVPGDADGMLFRLAPYIAFAPVFAAFLVIPFGPQFVFEATLNIGVLYLLAILGLEVMAVIMSGWGSNSKWAIYGAMREACQMVSYEIPLGVAILCGVLVAGTLNLSELSYLQGGGLHTWLMFHNPFIFIAFFIYFIASLASSKRAPFDLPESESELVAGFHTEYSGLRWSMFFFAEYAGMFIIGCILAVLYMGGWNSPLGPWDPVYMALGYDPVASGQAYLTGQLTGITNWGDLSGEMGLKGGAIGLFALNSYCTVWVIAKASFVILLHMWIRWTLPRIRIDQVMHGCVKGLLPVSLAMFVGTAVWLALIGPTAEARGVYSSISANVPNLTGEVMGVQLVAQIVLMLVGLALFGFYCAVVVWSFIVRKRAPRKGIFEDVMPVGKDVAFTRGPGYVPDDVRNAVT
ncbi:MAG: NADH-quinone oxidoreductase subunit NuoH [Planctomycetes bacterium]|nr:NADH-quinone oxidoreductase subunit NuoH [Planctomycetota bacterium]NOG53067.1 NADH-quinone oxidoreductase subunit NuoH [Planctomycetota bacterium]